MRLINLFTTFLLVYLFYGFYVSSYDTEIFAKPTKTQRSTHFYYYQGISNIHSNLSLGTSAYQQIVESGRKAGQDFLIFTDLNVFNFMGLDLNLQGFLTLFGAKYSYLDSRLIFFSSNKESTLGNLGEAQVFLTDLLAKKPADHAESLIYLAHPFHLGFDWTGPLPEGLDGIEVINIKALAMKSWQDSKFSVLWSLLLYPFNPRYAFLRLLTEPTEELSLLDEVASHRKVSAFAGAEASARAIPLSSYPIRFPSYLRTFEIAANHVQLTSELTGNLKSDREKLMRSLKQGNSYLSFDILGDSRGFEAYLDDGENILPIGTEMAWRPGVKIRAILPGVLQDFYEVVLLKEGKRFKTSNELDTIFDISEPGVYRVQVRVSPLFPLPDAKRWIPWIYTNSFWLK